MARVTRDKTGVDLAAGDKPSMSMMLKLARSVPLPPPFPLLSLFATCAPAQALTFRPHPNSDPELRAAAERLMAALRASGVEVDPKVALQALQMMGGDGFDKLKNGLEGYHEKVRTGEDGEGEGEGEGKGKK